MALTIQAVVSLDTRMFTAGIRGIEAQVNQFAGLAMMQFGGVAQQISAMWGAFGPAGAAISALGSITQVGAGYEQQMARVASYTQAAGDEMARLASDGIDMVAKFGFSAQQVGESMASLALAGVETANMTDVLQASLLLASATLGDANQSAELITSTLKVFQEDMAKAGQVADLFAGAIASSPLDLQRLSDSMKYAGATGAAFGMSMQQVVDEIAAFHQVGLRGQMAGTSFRGALLEMSAAASSAKGVVGAALQGWDAGAEGLTGAVRRLNDAGADASVVIQELGKRAGPGVAALMKLGADAMEDLSGKIRANSSVSAMHEKQMDTLAGQYKLLQGEITALATKIYNNLVPGLRDSLSQIRGGIQTFTDFASKISGLSGFINAVIPGIVRFATTVIGLNAAIKSLNFVGINTGIQSIGGLFAKLGESRKAAADLARLKTELSGVEKALYQVRLAGAKGMISSTDSAALSDLTTKANSAKAAFSALQAQGAKPFIQQASFAAMPRFDELNTKIGDATRLANELRQSMWRLKINPDPIAQAEWKSLAKAYDGCIKSIQGYRAEYAKLEIAVGRSGLSAYNAAVAESRKQMATATGAAEKFQSSLSAKSMKAYNDALADGTKKTNSLQGAIRQATTASGGFWMGLSKMQAGLSMLGAAIAGVQIGRFIADLRVPFTDHTVHEWLTLAISKCIDFRTTMADVMGELSPELTDLQKKIKGLKEHGTELANTFIEKLPKSLFYLSNLNSAMRDVEERTRAGAAYIKQWFDFDAGASGGTSGILVQLREMGELADSFGQDLADAFDPRDVRAFRQEITDLEAEATSLKSELQSKQESYNSSLAKATELGTQMREIEWEIDILKEQQRRVSEDEKAVINQQCVVLREKLDAITKAREAANNAAIEAHAALGKLTGKLGELNDNLQTTRGRLDDMASGIANARELQDALNAAWEEWEEDAKDAAAATDEVIAAFMEFGPTADKAGISIDAARAAVQTLGDRYGYFIKQAQAAGVEISAVGQNIQWMAKNQETARGDLERLGIAAEQVTAFMVKYGEHSLEVARRMATLGESEEEAAQKAGALGSALEEPTAKLKDMAEAVEGSVKPLMSLGAVSQARLTRIIGNIKALGDALGNINGGNKIDLSWLTALGSIVKLPRLTGVDGWLEKFDALATGIGNVAANMAGVNLDWMAKLKDFSLPNLGGIKEWKSDFSKWAAAVRTELPTLERFADALSSLQGSLSALNDATLKIVFKDESLLSRIESHLSTLASLKGVIWA